MAHPKIPMDARKLKAKTLAFRLEVVDKMSALATAAFGLVAALAWNNAIQAVFARYYPAPGSSPPVTGSIGPLLAYAAIITIIAVTVILLIGRFAGKLKAEAEDYAKHVSAPTL